MTRTDQIAAIRAACIEAHGEAKRAWKIGQLGEPIRLADVLLAIESVADVQSEGTFDDACGVLLPGFAKGGGKWNLRADDLEQQSRETLACVAGVLT